MLNSLYGQLLLKIQARVADKLSEIRYCDQDLGQLEHYNERPAVSFPCLLVDFTGTSYDQLGQLEETGDCKIMFKLGFAPFSSANNLSPDSVKEKALNYYELEYLLYQAFKAWNADGLIQPMNRKSDGTQQRNDAYRVRVSVYDTMFMDDGAVVVLDIARPALTFDFQS